MRRAAGGRRRRLPLRWQHGARAGGPIETFYYARAIAAGASAGFRGPTGTATGALSVSTF
uniref:Uncharacterized protein n=1 Tax=Nonomuraea gerenzanensis TaxID=93944 RepID=A0A1M4EHP8_9ACTN|nr:hypothetical protein BN4615_P7800 [Nonomuraea gerenzanensis]